MFRKFKNVIGAVVLTSVMILLSACGSKFASGDPYYYMLHEIIGSNDQDEVQLYIIDPFAGKVIIGGDAIEFDDIPDLEKYEDTDNQLFIKYGEGKTDQFEKKSDSLWISLDSGIEYDAKRKDEKFDYTPVKYELPWDEDYEAVGYLSGQTFTKHSGEGADQLSFLSSNRLIISIDDILPPYIVNLDDFEDYKDSQTIEFENIELTDSESGEFIVMYGGQELLKLRINEDNLLETEDGTTYMKN